MKKILSLIICCMIFSSSFVFTEFRVMAVDTTPTFNASNYMEAPGGYTIDFDGVYNQLNIGSTPSQAGEGVTPGVFNHGVSDESETWSEYGNVYKLEYYGDFTAVPYMGTYNRLMKISETLNKLVCVSTDFYTDNVNGSTMLFYTLDYKDATSSTQIANNASVIRINNGNICVTSTQTDTGYDVAPNRWYNFEMKIDYSNRVTYYYLDGNLIHTALFTTDGVGAARWNSSFPNNIPKTSPTVKYFDNINIKVFTEKFKASLDFPECDADEVPYENLKMKLTFSKFMNEDSFENIVVSNKEGQSEPYTGVYDNTTKSYTMSFAKLSARTKYSVDLSGVTSAEGGIYNGELLEFKTTTAPFSIESIVDSDGQLKVNINNRTDETKNGILIIGYYDSNSLYTSVVKPVLCSNPGCEFTLDIDKSGIPQGVKMEAYLIDKDTYMLIDKFVDIQ